MEGDSIGIVIPTGTDRQSEIVDSTLLSDVARRVGCVDWDAILIGFIGLKKVERNRYERTEDLTL